ncbi:Tex family protein [Listeria monocytogenes]|uniref:RNA-binding transcriptional accessory protein n=1 Tax=Listeria monocytogenes TaxID=1639 RepID=A0A6X4LVA3_LISMN|nr:Tex family protein [Listeria monocytogenes]EAF8203074.1 RNA-binding transcriptional accessory protein [Listeria monocytogenes]EAG9262487.1 RNA-binding transcriptional accessory protein [Listeria monocytogenes]EDH3592522.1 S1 RNA-binding domain-containing protein [Listeria monocytogenes]EFO8001644.1 RNA-binding transcriptional accessory protein [Listeria monocytogenes]EHN7541448.1 RNA-binding transcriptional accessory protein [Listeria monocytogenes]
MEQMQDKIIKLVQKSLTYKPAQINAVIKLMEEGNTVPFIARYRKEMTGSLDEVEIRDIEETFEYVTKLENRKEEIIRLIDEQGKLTDELRAAITKAEKHQALEDLYRPYKQKKRTKATIAKEKGLEPLADWLMSFPSNADPLKEAANYISEEKEVESAEAALLGAHEIIAEQISDEPSFREWIRNFTRKFGMIESRAKNAEADEKGVYEMYYEFNEMIGKVASHRILAFNRGEKEDILRVQVQVDTTKIFQYLFEKVIQNRNSATRPYVEEAILDAYKRFIGPAIEREIRGELTDKGEEQAIHIFSENLRKLLLQPPLKGKIILGVDPAFRTGCKFSVLDQTGKVLEIGVVYPHTAKAHRPEAKQKIAEILSTYKVEVIAIGNGTASRETEQFIVEVIRESKSSAYYCIVNEAGASVYSASETAREEFPDYQVEERSAVSIGRRLQDPLAELVKIDPKSVGVGQYQHDVAQKRLNETLTFVVETAVNQVGVNVNTASASLLQYVAGLNKTVANNIRKYREENGSFASRKELKKVPRLGAKSYEQSIGFLRILEGENPLDKTAIHPESYKAAEQIVKAAGFGLKDIGSEDLKAALQALSIPEEAEKLSIGKETMRDIIDNLIAPGRDLRDELPAPLLKQDVISMEDLKQGMELQGTVRNVVDFGAFVDIGVKQDGLVHISKLSNSFVKNPMDVVSVGDVVTVWVDEVDTKKNRIALTMLNPNGSVK